MTMRWTLTLEKKSEVALSQEVTARHLKLIAKAAERNATYGFKGRADWASRRKSTRGSSANATRCG